MFAHRVDNWSLSRQIYKPASYTRNEINKIFSLSFLYPTGGGPEVNVRLVGDGSPMSGRLEVYVHDQWGSVCAVNSRGEMEFGYIEASIVCRSLNFQGAARAPYRLERFIIYMCVHG